MSRIRLIPLALLAIVTAREARAVDGVIEINHARALAGGVTSGDVAGYPVTLSQAGSYRLTGTLSPSNASAIAITASQVTLDLNGFRISAVSSSLDGIDAAGQTDIRVSNGTIELFGGDGIQTGDRARIENVTVRANTGAGINVGAVSRVTGCTAYGNGSSGTGDGIFAGAASTVSDSTAVGNQGAGIHVLGSSTVSGNTVNGNVGGGLFIGEGSTVSENTASFNAGDGITTDAGCSVLHNTVRDNIGDGIEVSVNSSIIGNTVSNNARCGVHALGGPSINDRVAWSHNNLSSNNGGPTNRQAWGPALYAYAAFNVSGDKVLINQCGGFDEDQCLDNLANNCP